MDFSSVGQIGENSSPQLKWSCKFTDLAFAALGRVLDFCKTRKVSDMNEQACKEFIQEWSLLL